MTDLLPPTAMFKNSVHPRKAKQHNLVLSNRGLPVLLVLFSPTEVGITAAPPVSTISKPGGLYHDEILPSTIFRFLVGSLVLGGPLYQMFQRTRLSGSALELLHCRILVISLLAWLPLLLLSALEGNTLAGSLKIAFLKDLETQVRFSGRLADVDCC